MNHPPNFIVRNSKSTPITRNQSRQEQTSTDRLFATLHNFRREDSKEAVGDRLSKLEGNLKLLQKKYRQNLKQGFQNKIKSYRLQAVVQRKLLNQAIEQTQKDRQMSMLQEKYAQNQKLRNMNRQRCFLSLRRQQEKERFIKNRNEQQKRKLSITLYEQQRSLKQQNKETHDRIAWQENLSDRKKNFFQELKKYNTRKETLDNKKEIFTKMINNTEKLRKLKLQLEEMQEIGLNEVFLTF